MLTITQIHYIRKLYYDKGTSISDIEKKTGYNYRTIKKYLNKEDFNDSPYLKRRENSSDYLKPYIRDCILKYRSLKEKHQIRTAEAIYRYIVDQGIEIKIGKRRFRTIVKEVKQALNMGDAVYLELNHPGGEAQVDFGEIYLEEQGEMVKKHELILTFPYSNASYAQITESEQSEALFEALEKVFRRIGKVPKKLWFDQMSTAALRRKDEEGNVLMSKRLTQFSLHYGFESVFCNPNSGHEKGAVENKVGYVRRNFINTKRHIKDIDNLNEHLLKLCEQDQERIHYKKNKAIKQLFEVEKDRMRDVNQNPLDMSRIEQRRVDKYGHITFEESRYSVHPRYVGNQVNIKISAKKLILLTADYDKITVHKRSYHKGRTFTQWQHFIDPLKNRPRAIKYSGIYELLPKEWQNYFHEQSDSEVKEALGFLKYCLIHHDLDIAARVMCENARNNIINAEALWTTFYRITENVSLYNTPLQSEVAPAMPSYDTSLDQYDSLFMRSRDEG